MLRNVSAVLLIAVCPLVVAQQPLPAPAVAFEPAQTATTATLVDGTAVKLKICQTISSEEAKTGQEVPFEVLEDVSVSGVPVIRKGDSAFGTVTMAESKRRMGRAGKLDISINYVRLADQEKVHLRASKESKGHGATVGMVVGIAATGVLFFPAAPLFLLMHGKDVTIPQGTEITAFVEGDAHPDLARLGASIADPVAVNSTAITIDSNPSGADIEIAGAFVGSTPSTVSVGSGVYQISVKKSGFTSWERTLGVSGGSIHLSADLEPESSR